jgi:hypothetical protein
MEALRPIDICLGNFIESMGNIEIVTGILKTGDDSFQIAHLGWNKGICPVPEGILFDTFPIPLTEEWKVCFGIDKYELPVWVQYVHEVQNYFKWSLRINLLEVMNWDLLPKTCPTP